MKLIVQIPCLNEEATLPEPLRAIPRTIPGLDSVEVLVIDDGSSDGTSRVAREHGADHLVRFTRRKGLAAGFMAGLDACVRLGADVIVNTDADAQYAGSEIPRLIAPILAGEADMVIGDRDVGQVEHFSWPKRRLQTLGSWVVRKVSGTNVPDATSGFRALNREAALRINIVSEFTYTLESIIQAGKKKMAVTHLPISSRHTRPSRLFSSTWDYVKRSTATILRIYAMYEPFKVFVLIGSALTAAGLLLLVVDEGCADVTALRPAAAGARVIRHPYKRGNGAVVKTGIREARGELVLLTEADGQHDRADMSALVAAMGPSDMVMGA